MKHYSKKLKGERQLVSLDEWMNEQTECGIVIQWNIIQPKKEENSDTGCNIGETCGQLH